MLWICFEVKLTTTFLCPAFLAVNVSVFATTSLGLTSLNLMVLGFWYPGPSTAYEQLVSGMFRGF